MPWHCDLGRVKLIFAPTNSALNNPLKYYDDLVKSCHGIVPMFYVSRIGFLKSNFIPGGMFKKLYRFTTYSYLWNDITSWNCLHGNPSWIWHFFGDFSRLYSILDETSLIRMKVFFNAKTHSSERKKKKNSSWKWKQKYLILEKIC